MAGEAAGFLGRGWSFPPSFSNRLEDVELCRDGLEDIRQSLHILFATRPGERIMRPEYGCDISPLMFQEIDATLMAELESRVTRAIALWEPRIDLLAVSARQRRDAESTVEVLIDFRVRTTNTRNNLVYPFYLNEATLVANAP